MATKKSKPRSKLKKKKNTAKHIAVKQTSRKALPKKKAAPKKPAQKKKAQKKKPALKKPALKKPALKRAPVILKAPAKKTVAASKVRVARKRLPERTQTVDREAFAPRSQRARSAGQSGDLQGLSDREGADSESVDELVEEGNAFEADVVAGVERAGNADEQEVHTHEVPEDDVPEEYLDEK
jgi:hypothetical protein